MSYVGHGGIHLWADESLKQRQVLAESLSMLAG
jgi:hypothetical protein